MHLLLPTPLLPLLLLLPLTQSTPSPPFLPATDLSAISLIPRHTLFYRQLADLQTFSSALGGTRASAITNSGDAARPFSVDGSTFDSFASAAQRSCDNQFQACADRANGVGGGNQNQGSGNRVQGSSNGNGNRIQGNSINGNRRTGGGNNNKARKGKRADADDGMGMRGREMGWWKRQDGGGLTVQQCDEQKNECKAAQTNAAVQDFATPIASTNIGPDPLFPDFDLICEG